MQNNRDLQRAKMGRELAKNCFSSLVMRTKRILNDSDIGEHVAILSYGSAGNHFFIGNSDTDFTLLDDGSLSKAEISKLQSQLIKELDDNPWPVRVKTWDRVKVNPMDLLSLCFIGGNRELFERYVLQDPDVSSVNCEDVLVSTLAGNDLHLDFMASYDFSRLLCTYHPTHEMPVGISYGDVKYFKGGTRWIQDIYMIAMLYSKKKFLTDIELSILVEQNIFTKEEIYDVNRALDFLLTVKDICIEGSNILYVSNMDRIKAVLGASEREITGEYDYHINKIQELCHKAHQALVKHFSSNTGVLARTVSHSDEISNLINTDALDLWRTLALRTDLPTDAREVLANKIFKRQKNKPHTMLDELVSMLEFSAPAVPVQSVLDVRKAEDEINQWLTDQVVDHFKGVLKGNMDHPCLIRLAVQSSFFNWYKVGKYPDPQSFYHAYFDRTKKFFHCHTVFPDDAVLIAENACIQVFNSGLFKAGRVTLLELHLTNYCNLNCSYCTYKSKDSKHSIQFDDLVRIKDLAPMEVLIAGGGEPTLFRENGRDFNDVIGYLRECFPGTRIRLITNGTVIPEGDWLSKADEISVSLDDESRESFLANKKNNLFDAVWNNIQAYLYKSPVSNIRITKIFNRQNVEKSIVLAEKVFLLWNNLPTDDIKRSHFKFLVFPMADDQKQDAPYNASLLTADQKSAWLTILSDIKNTKPEFYAFIENNTNLLDLAKTDPVVLPAERCWPVTHYILLGADRKIYPCFASCSSFRATALGDVNMTLDELTEKRTNLFSNPPLQCRSGCRPSSVFYGLRSKEYHHDQLRLQLPALQEKLPARQQIVHVSYHDPGSLGGGQGWAVYNLCKEQVKRGEPVYWISPCIKEEQPGEYLYENGLLRVIKIKFTDEAVYTLFADDEQTHNLRLQFGDIFVKKIKECFNPENFCVHLHGSIEVPRHSTELRAHGYKVISTFHMLLSTRNKCLANDPDTIKHLRKAEKIAIGGNSIITVPSKGMAKDLMEVCPDYKGTIYCVPNGVGEELFSPLPIQPASPARHTILSYGRISPEKGLDLFVASAKLLMKNMSPEEQSLYQFIVFGNTDLTIEARRLYAENLEKSAQEYPNIKISASAKGIVGTEKIKLIDQASFGIILSLYEPFGMVIPELMARGKPVITTLTSGTKDIMKTDQLGRNDFGFIVEPTVPSITEAIGWMVNHPQELEEMSKNVLDRSKDYQWKNVVDQFYDLYRL